MKRNFIIGGIIAAVGFLILGLTFLIGLSGNYKSQTAYTNKEYTATSKFQSVVIDDSNCPVHIYGTDKSYIYIKYSERRNETYSFKASKGVLQIQKHNNRPWYQFFNLTFSKGDLEIYIPKSDLQELNVDTSNDDITVEDLNSQIMTLSTSNGSIDMNNVKISDNLHVDTSNDDITLKDVTVTNGEITGKTSNSEINLNNVIAQSISMKTSNDSISLENIVFAKSGVFNTSNGEIEGTIKGRLADFKEINSKTSHGDNSFPDNTFNSSGTKYLTLDTSNDDIDVSIQE